MVFHFAQKSFGYWHSRIAANHGINATFRANSGGVLINPFDNLCWRKDAGAMKASAENAGMDVRAVI
jgi:hypothetical protein